MTEFEHIHRLAQEASTKYVDLACKHLELMEIALDVEKIAKALDKLRGESG